jgi:mevalonate kinase
MSRFRSSGKLLLSGEYWVLHGAEALAIVTEKGQTLHYEEADCELHWVAKDHEGSVWMDCAANQDPYLARILSAAQKLNGNLPHRGRVSTQLEFNRNWGWGSSSSLIDLIAQWTGLDPMELHFETSEGSGFDVACARAGGAIAYQKTGPRSAVWNNVASAHWPHEHFGLVYLGGKQDSQREVAKIRREPLASELDAISALSRHLASSSNAETWMQGIDELEDRTASWLQMERVQKRFPGVRATIKSLGAWGGDFALAVAQDPEDLAYFSLKGHLFLKWSDCVSLHS